MYENVCMYAKIIYVCTARGRHTYTVGGLVGYFFIVGIVMKQVDGLQKGENRNPITGRPVKAPKV